MNPRTCFKTDIGLKREENEDTFLFIDDHDLRYESGSLGKLFAVADGMGGHKGGAEASRMACERLLDYYYADRSGSSNTGDFGYARLRILDEAFHRADLDIHDVSLRVRELEGMGTTLSALVLLKETALIAHVGDSRIYRLRNHRLERLTQDHTMAQLSIEMGYMDEEEAARHPQSNILTDVIGQGFDEVQTRMEQVRQGDLFLLCTDGLHHTVSESRIQEIMESFSVEDTACDRLVREAIQGGGRDNITVILVHV
ncbi:MAG: hypothetical protein CVU57_28150 [Deltaproteobacteria bacterium HGW-Deltaproteobacteria-15]|jgi:protein phosphatase|nr:MAG: hypothetical protein CVU57_28150 [Deltaproteobacteria bacterium HGW-Deltaproteobacteria-15]